jgi:predicted unusual protein kinase regulating ubiquinone biosynthesis (AarF/ABC1/UbiB family)
VRRRGTFVAAGGLGIAVGIALARRSRRRSVATAAAPHPGSPRRAPITLLSRTDRAKQLARMGGRAGASFALHRAQRTFASAERQARLDADFELRTAEQVADALGQMKGALMKLGQMASYLDTGMAEPVRDALASLQQDAPPMSGQLAAEVVERELGAPPEQLFLEWDPVPIASASIGQVHRGITRDERAVAVKVQYPGVDEAIRSDLENAGVLFGVVGMMFPGLDPGPLVDEIRSRVTEELDYKLEATHQQHFADYYRAHPFIHVPDVVPELSCSRVLTTELAEGARFEEMTTWSQDERNLAAEAIYRFVFRSLYRLHAFNGDPHPGNYLFRPGGQVTFLDFGLVKHFAPADVDLFGRMIDAMVMDHDLQRYRGLIEEAGLMKRGHSHSFSDAEILDYYGHFYEFVMEDAEVTITSEWSRETVQRFFDPNGPYGPIAKSANLPANFVIIQRINLGLMAVLGDLTATANFRRIAEELWPWIDGPPASDLGRAEAAWLTRAAHG